MTFEPANSKAAYVPNFTTLTEDFIQNRRVLNDYLSTLVEATNGKDIGLYVDQVVVNGQLLTDTNNRNRLINIYRKLTFFTALPNAGTVMEAHGITFSSGSRITRIYGAASDTTAGRYVPIPYVDVNAPGDGLELFADNTNITIESAANWSSFSGLVVIEFVRE